MTEEEIRERDELVGTDIEWARQAVQDRRWLLRELDRVRKDLVICRKSKSVYDYSDKMSERVKVEVNHLLKEKVKRLEEQLAEAQKDTERLDWSPTEEGWGAYYDDRLGEWNLVSITSPIGRQGVLYALTLKDLIPKCQAADNARGKE